MVTKESTDSTDNAKIMNDFFPFSNCFREWWKYADESHRSVDVFFDNKKKKKKKKRNFQFVPIVHVR